MTYDESSLIDPTEDVARERALRAATDAHPDVAAAWGRYLDARDAANATPFDISRMYDDDDPYMAAQDIASDAFDAWERLAASKIQG